MEVKNIQRLMYVVGFLDLGGVMLILPLFVIHLRTLGMSPLVGGLVRSLYGILQLISSPLVGRWSDKYGRRPLLLASLAVSCAGYSTLGATNSVFIMCASRILTGVFKHSTTLCKAVLADVTEVGERSLVLGKLGAAMGLAVILGPALGGQLTDFENGFTLVCSISTGIFFLNLVLCYAVLPSKLPLHSQFGIAQSSEKDPLNDSGTSNSQSREADGTLDHFLRVIRDIDWPVFGDIFLVDFFLTFAVFTYRSSFVLLIDQMFGASAKTIGYIISFQGLIGAGAGLLTGKISKLYGSTQLELFHSSIMLAGALLGLTFAPNVISVILLLVPLSVSSTVINTAVSAIIIQRSDPSKIGSVTGFGQSIQAVAGMTTPVLSSLAQEASVYGPGVLSSLAAVAGAALAGYVAHRKNIKKEL